jgi:hypothetical protein
MNRFHVNGAGWREIQATGLIEIQELVNTQRQKIAIDGALRECSQAVSVRVRASYVYILSTVCNRNVGLKGCVNITTTPCLNVLLNQRIRRGACSMCIDPWPLCRECLVTCIHTT